MNCFSHVLDCACYFTKVCNIGYLSVSFQEKNQEWTLTTLLMPSEFYVRSILNVTLKAQMYTIAS